MEVTRLPQTNIVLEYGSHSPSAWGVAGIATRLQRWTTSPVLLSPDKEIADNAIVLMLWSVYAEQAWPAAVRRRIVIVDLERGRETKDLEAEQVAGGIGKWHYWEWRADTSGADRVAGLFARRDVLATMPGPFVLAPTPFASDHYACVYDAPYPDLAAMIVAYATAVLAMPAR